MVGSRALVRACARGWRFVVAVVVRAPRLCSWLAGRRSIARVFGVCSRSLDAQGGRRILFFCREIVFLVILGHENAEHMYREKVNEKKKRKNLFSGGAGLWFFP